MSTPSPDHRQDRSREEVAPSRAGGRMRAGLGIALACALACSLPLVVGGAAVAGAGAALTGALGAALVLLGVSAAGIVWYARRRRSDAVLPSAGACGCGGGCGT